MQANAVIIARARRKTKGGEDNESGSDEEESLQQTMKKNDEDQRKFQYFWRGIQTGLDTYERKHKYEKKQYLLGKVAKKTNAIHEYVFSPNSNYKIVWDLTLAALVIYSIVVIPYNIGMAVNPGVVSQAVDWLITVLFGVDILVNFNTAYVDEATEKLEFNRTLIAINYSKFWLWVDILATIPFDSIIGAFVDASNFSTIRVIRVLRLVRLVKIYRIFAEDERMENIFANPALFSLVVLILQIFYVAHIFACFFHYITLDTAVGNFPTTWVKKFEFDDKPVNERYVASLYYVIITMTTVGYGDIYGTNQLERFFAILTMLTGGVVFGALVGRVTSLIDKRNPQAKAFKERMDEFKCFLTECHIPKDVGDRAKASYFYYLTKRSAFGEAGIFDELPRTILKDLVYELYSDDIAKVNLFNSIESAFVIELITNSRPFQAYENEDIFREGDVCNEIIFVKDGNVRILSSAGHKNVVIGCVTEGDYFGDAEFLKNTTAVATYQSVGTSHMLSVPHSVMTRAMAASSNTTATQLNRWFEQRYANLASLLRSKGVKRPDRTLHSPLKATRSTLFGGLTKNVSHGRSFFGFITGGVKSTDEGDHRIHKVSSSSSLTSPSKLHVEVNVDDDSSDNDDDSSNGSINLRTGRGGPPAAAAGGGAAAAAAAAAAAGASHGSSPTKSPSKTLAGPGPGPSPLRRPMLTRQASKSAAKFKLDTISRNLWVNGEIKDSSTSMAFLSIDDQLFHKNIQKVRVVTITRDGEAQAVEKPAKFLRDQRLLNPMGPQKIQWDFFVGLLILYSVLVVPVEIAFSGNAFAGSDAVNMVINGFFFVDIVVSFFTAIQSEELDALIVDKAVITGTYLSSWFLIDVVSTVPFDDIVAAATTSSKDLSFTKLVKVIRLLRLLKLARILKLSSYIEKIEDAIGISPIVFSLLTLLVQVFFIAHWACCLWWGITSFISVEPWFTNYGSLIDDDKVTSAIGNGQKLFPLRLVGGEMSAQYLMSLYYILTTMTTVGYGDIRPTTMPERAFGIVLALCGASLFGYMIANVSSLISSLGGANSSAKEHLSEVSEYLKEKNCPLGLQEKIKNHYKRQVKEQSAYDVDRIVGRLPSMISNEILFYLNERRMQKITFFHYIHNKSVAVYLLQKLSPIFCDEGHYLFREGEFCKEISFIVSGEAHAFRAKSTRRSKPGFVRKASFTESDLWQKVMDMNLAEDRAAEEEEEEEYDVDMGLGLDLDGGRGPDHDEEEDNDDDAAELLHHHHDGDRGDGDEEFCLAGENPARRQRPNRPPRRAAGDGYDGEADADDGDAEDTGDLDALEAEERAYAALDSDHHTGKFCSPTKPPRSPRDSPASAAADASPQVSPTGRSPSLLASAQFGPPSLVNPLSIRGRRNTADGDTAAVAALKRASSAGAGAAAAAAADAEEKPAGVAHREPTATATVPAAEALPSRRKSSLAALFGTMDDDESIAAPSAANPPAVPPLPLTLMHPAAAAADAPPPKTTPSGGPLPSALKTKRSVKFGVSFGDEPVAGRAPAAGANNATDDDDGGGVEMSLRHGPPPEIAALERLRPGSHAAATAAAAAAAHPPPQRHVPHLHIDAHAEPTSHPAPFPTAYPGERRLSRAPSVESIGSVPSESNSGQNQPQGDGDGAGAGIGGFFQRLFAWGPPSKPKHAAAFASSDGSSVHSSTQDYNPLDHFLARGRPFSTPATPVQRGSYTALSTASHGSVDNISESSAGGGGGGTTPRPGAGASNKRRRMSAQQAKFLPLRETLSFIAPTNRETAPPDPIDVYAQRKRRPLMMLSANDYDVLGYQFLGKLETGDFIGHAAFLRDEAQEQHHCSVRTVHPTTAYVLSKHEISRLIRSEPTVAIQFQAALKEAVMEQVTVKSKTHLQGERAVFLRNMRRRYQHVRRQKVKQQRRASLAMVSQRVIPRGSRTAGGGGGGGGLMTPMSQRGSLTSGGGGGSSAGTTPRSPALSRSVLMALSRKGQESEEDVRGPRFTLWEGRDKHPATPRGAHAFTFGGGGGGSSQPNGSPRVDYDSGGGGGGGESMHGSSVSGREARDAYLLKKKKKRIHKLFKHDRIYYDSDDSQEDVRRKQRQQYADAGRMGRMMMQLQALSKQLSFRFSTDDARVDGSHGGGSSSSNFVVRKRSYSLSALDYVYHDRDFVRESVPLTATAAAAAAAAVEGSGFGRRSPVVVGGGGGSGGGGGGGARASIRRRTINPNSTLPPSEQLGAASALLSAPSTDDYGELTPPTPRVPPSPRGGLEGGRSMRRQSFPSYDNDEWKRDKLQEYLI